MSIVISVNEIQKKFKVYHDKGSSLKEKVLFKNRNYYEERWVLKGVSFDIKKGEAIGLIGHNGCGKSTLLKLLTKIIYPDSGTINMNGRVSSLIELGAGFHPDMSGRENIYTNASIFGLTKKEIDRRLDTIIKFSELEEFIDNPVRTYSSGMYMRLAFSVAINVDADILLIDEILAVGDANFQAKCFNKLRELKSSGTTIVIVTHDTGTVQRFCDKVIWLNDGVIVGFGKSIEIVDKYLSYMNEKFLENINNENIHSEDIVDNQNESDKDNEDDLSIDYQDSEEDFEKENNEDTNCEVEEHIDTTKNRFGLKYIEIRKAYMKNKLGENSNIFKAGEPLSIEIYYKVNKKLEEYVFGMGFYDMDDNLIYGNNIQLDNIKYYHSKTEGKITFYIPELPLLSGRYKLNVAVVDVDNTPMDFFRDYMHFDVVSSDKSVGMVSIKHEWIIDDF